MKAFNLLISNITLQILLSYCHTLLIAETSLTKSVLILRSLALVTIEALRVKCHWNLFQEAAARHVSSSTSSNSFHCASSRCSSSFSCHHHRCERDCHYRSLNGNFTVKCFPFLPSVLPYTLVVRDVSDIISRSVMPRYVAFCSVMLCEEHKICGGSVAEWS